MFFRKQKITKQLFKQLKRYWSDGSLVVETGSKESVVHITPCAKSKSKKTNNSVDSEYIWLENLNLENMKLYRKTSIGSFRKINIPSFLEKLKVIIPDELSQKAADKSSTWAAKAEKQVNVTPSRFMSDFLIQNMTTFPLLKSQCDDSLKNVIMEDEEVELIQAVRYPSVSRILQETMPAESKERLEKWQLKMIEKLGEEKFQLYKMNTFNQGSKFHGAIRKYLESGEERLVSIDQSIEGAWNSVSKVLEDIDNVVMVEQAVCHPILSYKGFVDCVASYRNVPYVIEWKKTSKKVKSISNLYDAPVQVCAYQGALSWRKDLPGHTPTKCLLVIAYSSGEPADVFPVDLEECQIYWSNFMHRLQSFWARSWPELKPTECQM